MSSTQSGSSGASPGWTGTGLILGVGMDLEPRDDGVYIRVLVAPPDTVESAPDDADAGYLCDQGNPETWDPILQKIVARDFYKTQTYLELANSLNERAKERDHLNAGRLANKFRSRCEALEAHDDEVQEQLRSPTVDQLINETDRVEYRIVGGDGLVSISVIHDGKETTVDYEPEEWLNSTGEKFAAAYWGAFFVELELDPEDWDHLKGVWKEQAVEVGGDDYGELDAVAESIIDKLQRRLSVHSSREAVQNATYGAWYETAPGDRLYSLDDDHGPIVWVRSLALTQEVDSAGKSASDVPEIVDHLRDTGAIVTARKKLDNKRVYGWSPDPEALDIDEREVLDEDESDGHHGVEP